MSHTFDQSAYLQTELNSILSNFIHVSHMAGYQIASNQFDLKILPAPHVPASLPEGKMAVYGFYFMGEWLKIGKAGPNSGPRYKNQHYLPKGSNSNLAKSILQDSDFRSMYSLDNENIKSWMFHNLSRFNILIDDIHPPELLKLLESFLHMKFGPKYEGRLLD